MLEGRAIHALERQAPGLEQRHQPRSSRVAAAEGLLGKFYGVLRRSIGAPQSLRAKLRVIPDIGFLEICVPLRFLRRQWGTK